jgi:hypothetical protein
MPPAIEIARRRVVHGVGASPEIARRERQHPDRASDPVVGATTMEEGAMTAIMLDHEKPHQKARGRRREQQAKPVANIKGRPHQAHSKTNGPTVITTR